MWNLDSKDKKKTNDETQILTCLCFLRKLISGRGGLKSEKLRILKS